VDLGVAAQDFEGLVLVEVVAFHEDSLGLADPFAGVEGGVEIGFFEGFDQGNRGVASEDVDECRRW